LNVAFHTAWTNGEVWLAALRAAAPEIEFRHWPDVGDPATVDVALVWNPPRELFGGMSRLKLVQVLGAGVDALMRSEVLPAGVPIARLVDPVMSQRMAEYALYGALRFHRQFDRYEAQRQATVWQRHDHLDPPDVSVGVLGAGEIGMTAARLLQSNGYDVACWARSVRDPGPISVFAGREQLPAFLARSRVLVCLLPLTAETRGILGRETFAALPRGAFVINAARGEHVDVPALLEALDAGQLDGAMLDVFAPEPLAAESPLWRHPKVLVTPHVAGISHLATSVEYVVDQLRRFGSGEAVRNIVERERGY
jgi:glyoxylate/hydroxypyruvate reductase